MIKIVLAIICLMISFESYAKERFAVEMRVTEPYLELHTGPASEYRIEHVLLTGEKIQLIKQHADWFYFKKNKTVKGWAPLKVLLDNRIDSVDMSFDEFLINFEGDLEFDLMFSSGLVDGDFFLGFEIAQQYDEDIRFALSLRQVPGKISESVFTTIDFNYLFDKLKAVRPFVVFGFGELVNKPSAQVIGGEEISSSIYKLGAGIYFAESKRIKFSAGLMVYQPESEAFNKNLQELSIGLRYDF